MLIALPVCNSYAALSLCFRYVRTLAVKYFIIFTGVVAFIFRLELHNYNILHFRDTFKVKYICASIFYRSRYFLFQIT